jgi:ABC-2 type transport system permease protein
MRANRRTAAAPQPSSERINWRRMMVVCRTDLRQLSQAKDFLLPMAVMAAIFYIFVPGLLLTTINTVADRSAAAAKVGEALALLPRAAREAIPTMTPAGEPISELTRASYALAVYLFASLAVVVPVTIGNAVGASAIVGERERGTGEFLAHSPAGVREVYLGKLLASFIPGYISTVVGFACYSLVVNLTVGREIGRWFFPTPTWWVLMLWVVPAFLAITLSVVLRVSGRVSSTTAAHQIAGLVSFPAILISYGQATSALASGGRAPWITGAIAWAIAGVSLWRAIARMPRWRLLGVAIDA